MLGTRRPDLESWSADTLREIAKAREMLVHWVGELSHYAEGPGAGQPESEKALCECSRMVVVAGETLDNLTRIFTRWADCPVPEGAWDITTAAETDRLLELAARSVTSPPYATNCQIWLAYVRRMWPRWCPAFDPQPVPAP